MKASAKNTFSALPDELRPRERMVSAGNPDALSDRELLMVMLKTGTAGCDVEETAKRLLCAFGSLGEFVRCSWQELEAHLAEWNRMNPERRVLGVGRAKILELAAAFELAKRGFRTGPNAVSAFPIRRAKDAAVVFARRLAVDEERERFRVLLLDARRYPLCDPLPVSSGSIEGTFVHPREVFKAAIRRGAQSVIVSHNHPGGSPEPSDEDLDLLILGDGDPESDIPFVSLRALHPDLFI